jgi:hypothetical protein
MDMNLRLLRRLVGRTDARELLYLARLGLLVQALGIALLGDVDGDVDEDFDEGERRVGVLGVGVELARDLAVGFVGADEAGESDSGGVREEFGDLIGC